MVNKMGLLELLSVLMECEYLSDLHFLSCEKRMELAEKLETIEPSEYDLREWNDALAYLFNALPEDTADEAKYQMIKYLRLQNIK